MESKDLLRKLNALKEHRPIVVNYGKSKYTGNDILEESYWNEKKEMYGSDTGWWNIDLLIEIAKREVEDTSLEVLEND